MVRKKWFVLCMAVILGGGIVAAKAASGAEKLIAADNFDRGNADTLGRDWTTDACQSVGLSEWQIRDKAAYKTHETVRVKHAYSQFENYTLGSHPGFTDVVEVKYRRVKANWGGLALHIQNEKTLYAMRLTPHDKEDLAGRLQIIRLPEDKSLGWCFTEKPLKTNTWYTIIAKTDNAGCLGLELWNKEKTELLGRMVAKDDQPLTGGKAGLYELRCRPGGTRWDDFTIKATDARWWELAEKEEEEITERRPKVEKAPGGDYQVTIASTMVKVRGGASLGEESDTISVHLARNERESRQVIVVAGKDLSSVEIETADLEGVNGQILGKESISWNPVDYVYLHNPLYAEKGLYPDPLLPREPIDVEERQVQPFLITLYAPPEQEPGIYNGELTVKAENATARKLKVVARVYDAAIPDRPTVRTDFWFFAGDWEDFYGKKLTLEDWKRWLAFFKQYRCVPGWLQASFAKREKLFSIRLAEDGELQFDFEKFAEWLGPMVEAGANAINVNLGPNPGTFKYLFPTTKARSYGAVQKQFTPEEQKEAMMQFYEAFVRFLKQKGWFKYAFYYGFGEAGLNPERLQMLREWHPEIKKRCPELKRSFPGAKAQYGYDEHIDIYCPLLNEVHPEHYKGPQMADKELWHYVCDCSPAPPYPNVLIFQSGIDHRIIPWMMWKYRMTGFLYWGVNYWKHRTKVEGPPIKNWPSGRWVLPDYQDYDRAGDGILCYPGPNGEPLASLRLVNLRDGFEDYELLNLVNQMLEQRAETSGPLAEEAKKLLNMEPDIVNSLKDFVKDPKTLDAYRNKLLVLAEKLSQRK